VINWGVGIAPRCLVINHPDKVRLVANKLTFFRYYDEHDGAKHFNVPLHMYTAANARDYLRNTRAGTIVARTLTSSNEGRGIVMADNPDDVPDCSLYTAYVKKKYEYRVHVMAGNVIDEVQKKRRLNYDPNTDGRIRNTANGYVFARTGVQVPQCVRDAAVAAVQFYGLDFGAVDVVYNEHYDKAYVLEINTAPGIEGTTVQRYAAAFRRFFNV